LLPTVVTLATMLDGLPLRGGHLETAGEREEEHGRREAAQGAGADPLDHVSIIPANATSQHWPHAAILSQAAAHFWHVSMQRRQGSWCAACSLQAASQSRHAFAHVAAMPLR